MKKKGYLIILLFTISFQVITLVRTSFFASFAGTSSEADSYYLATILAITVTNLVTAAISTILVPKISKYHKDKQGIEDIITYVKYILAYTIIGSLTLTTVALLFFRNDFVFILLFLILISTQLIRSSTALFTAYFQVKELIVYLKLANLLAAIFTLSIFLVENINIFIFTGVISVSFLIEFLILFLWLAKNKKSDVIAFLQKMLQRRKKTPELKDMLLNTKNIVISASAFQVAVITSNLIANTLGTGTVAVFNYSMQLLSLVTATILANFILIIYPKISKIMISNEFSLEMKQKKMSVMLILGLFIFMNVTIMFIIFGREVITYYLVRGNFSNEDGRLVFLITSILFVSLPFGYMRDVIYRIFYSINNTKIPSRNSLIAVSVNIFSTIIFVYLFGIYGLAFGPLISTLFSSINAYILLNKTTSLKLLRFNNVLLILLPLLIVPAVYKTLTINIDFYNTTLQFALLVFLTLAMSLIIYSVGYFSFVKRREQFNE